MPRGLRKALFAGWLIFTPLLLLISLYLYTDTYHNGFVGDVLSTNDNRYALFSAPPPMMGAVSQSFVAGDARVLLVEHFLHAYHSPIQGNGEQIVLMADKYGIDWRLVPSIAFQESSLGRVMPKGSYNAWGWAIFTGQDSGATFKSWPDAIEKVSRGLSRNYYSRGLKSPKQIQSRYAPDSNGSWSQAVQGAMEEIETGTS